LRCSESIQEQANNSQQKPTTKSTLRFVRFLGVAEKCYEHLLRPHFRSARHLATAVTQTLKIKNLY
jgi:hypothetical protein